MHLKSGKKLKADCLLYANGRTGNTDSLQLENIGLETDSRGQLKVNSMYQTALPHVYAVGDVIGYPSLASAAYDQGRIAAQALVKGEATAHLIEDIPTGFYQADPCLGINRRVITHAVADSHDVHLRLPAGDPGPVARQRSAVDRQTAFIHKPHPPDAGVVNRLTIPGDAGF
jgi:hypothetical protein